MTFLIIHWILVYFIWLAYHIDKAIPENELLGKYGRMIA